MLTGKREAENYLHPAAVQRALGITVTITDQDSVPEMGAHTLHASEAAAHPWTEICTEKRAKKIASAKRRLNDEAASAMTTAELRERDPDGDIENWLRVIASKLI